MKVNSILLNPKDNVVTAVNDINEGEDIQYLKNGELYTIKASEKIPSYHKVVISEIKKNEHVIKYGEIIGAATENLTVGRLANHLNIASLPRDYEMEIRRE